MGSKSQIKPPKLPEQFLRWFCSENLIEFLQGDLYELYDIRLKKYGKFRAGFFYFIDVLSTFRPFAFRKQNSNLIAMFRHNLIIAIRNLKRRKVSSAINTLGLTLGLFCSIVIFILIRYHTSFDNFHKNPDRIFRVVTEFHLDDVEYNTGVPSLLGETIRNDYTHTERVARVATFDELPISVHHSNNQILFKEKVAYAEPQFFDIMNFPLLRGDKNTVLSDPNSAIITKHVAQKYFGNEDPIGKVITINNSIEVIVTGVLQNLPEITDRREEIYLPFSNVKDQNPGMVEEDWWYSVYKNMQCFLRLKGDVQAVQVDQDLDNIIERNYDEKQAKIWDFELQPIADIHFNTNLDGQVQKENLWILGLIGMFLIITTCINFVNLTTAQALSRSKEIGIKKVLGSSGNQLFWQSIAETALIAVVAIFLAILLSIVALPYVNQLFDLQLSINLFQDAGLAIFSLSILVFIVFLSGSYPGILVAGFQPIKALKGNITGGTGRLSLRKGLVVSQFTISQLLIISAIIITHQMRYALNGDMGFDKESIIMLPLNGIEQASTLQTKLKQLPEINNTSLCNAAPLSDRNPHTNIRFDSRAEDENFSIYIKHVDHNYIPTFDIPIIEGRNFIESNAVGEYLVNETAVKKLGLSTNRDAIGKHATINGRKGVIVGVFKDFHNKSFHASIDPLCITSEASNYSYMAIKMNIKALRSTLTSIEDIWRESNPNMIFDFIFIDDQVERFYKTDMMLLHLVQAFTAVAIIISCFGLYGLITFITSRRIKEIGIRKVLGASVRSILWLLGKEFGLLLGLGFLIAAPIATWLMSNWLENYLYRIDIGLDIYGYTISFMMVIMIITVSYRSFKAATVNPVRNLRSE